MKKYLLFLCTAALISGGILAGCSNTESAVSEITSSAPEVESLAAASAKDGWTNAASTYEALDGEAETQAKAINSSNVKETVLEDIDIIVDNIPAIVSASKSGEITSETEAAAKEIYVSAKTLKTLGDYSAQDVSLYIADIADDALTMLQNLYDGLESNVDARQSECDVNRDRILCFTDEEWAEFAANL